MIYIDPKILERVNTWLTPTFDKETQQKIKELIAHNPEELEDSFYKSLAFGTGGMRGIMGVGDNRINKYTLGKNTQGLSNYLKKQFPNQKIKVAIAYDCRHNSKALAKIVADVFTANQIQVYLFSDLRPTPELSFAVRYLSCQSGIVLTASHNPPEYNGYKVYWEDGAQLVPPQDSEVIQEINKVAYSQINFNGNAEFLTYIDTEIDEAFALAALEHGAFNTPQVAKDHLDIVFTSLHGTSITMVPKVLEKAGYKNVHIVKDQATPDGDFPTVQSPNPEEPEALTMALELAKQKHADIVIGTDPDCDRIGIAVKNPAGDYTLFNGNQTMVVMTHFLLDQWKKLGKITGNELVASTIVSTPLVKKIVEDFGVVYKESLTGFKWIAKLIRENPQLKFIGGGEESFGYLVGDFVRDKDAVTSSLLVCEIAAQKKAIGSSFYNYLYEIFKTYGCYKEHLISIVKKGKKGAEEIAQMMKNFRAHPFSEIAGSPVVKIEDYLSGEAINLQTKTKSTLDIPKSNVLIYYTADGSKIAMRPSGTEPKIKFYMSVNKPFSADCENTLNEKIKHIIKTLNLG
jgi:phosphomannomutase